MSMQTFLHFAPHAAVILLLLLFLFVAIPLMRRLAAKWQLGAGEREAIQRAWKEVETHLASRDETHLRMAIIKADAVLDMALKAKAFPGNQLYDRLRAATYKYPALRKVKGAHALRNKLAHEPLAKLSTSDGRRAVQSFRTALRDLGAL